jgi:thiol-disulfide isomerase/thioredoxin
MPLRRSAGSRRVWRVLGLLAVIAAIAAVGWRWSAETGATSGRVDVLDRSMAERVRFALVDAPQELPELRFVDGDGRALTLADFRGKVVLLNIWATWCAPCRHEMPTLDNLQAAVGGPEMEVLALSIDQAGVDVVKAFYEEIGLKHLRVYIDKTAQAGIALNTLGIPTTLIIDREGRELGRRVGAAEWDSPEMVAFLRDVVARTRKQE